MSNIFVKIDDENNGSLHHAKILVCGINWEDVPDEVPEEDRAAALHHVSGVLARIACAAQQQLDRLRWSDLGCEDDPDSNRDRCYATAHAVMGWKGWNRYWRPVAVISVPRASVEEWLEIVRGWLTVVSNP
jgi:hypothetical protein